MELTWKRRTGRFETGANCYLGPYKVGAVFYSPTFSTQSKWSPTCFLPGAVGVGPKDTEAEARRAVEEVVKQWADTVRPFTWEQT